MQITIELTYNPFLRKNKSTLLINGKKQKKDYLDYNLQSWIGGFFEGLEDEWEGCKSFDFTFKGLEVDCQDVREIVEEAKKKGFDITFKSEVVDRSTSERLVELEDLLAEMKNNPIFKDKIEQHNGFKALEENVFDVFVVATMSSGKSTFINAMLGCDLLPAQNEATTATIAEIIHDPELKQGEFYASRKNIDGEFLDQNIKLDLSCSEKAKEARILVSQWNKEIDNKEIELINKTATIHLRGRLVGIEIPNKLKLRLSDTPGPNNSNEVNHSQITLNKIKDTQGNNPLIIYLLNGQQIAINDDNQLLRTISKEMNENGRLASDRFLFVVNKMDDFFNKDEVIYETLERVKTYLEKHHIFEPKIYPIVANLAKLERVRALNSKLLDEDESDNLESLTRKINRNKDRDLTQYMPLNTKVKPLITAMAESPLKRSGVSAVEKVITNYIEKYNEPYRIMQISEVITDVFNGSQADFENILHLRDKSQGELIELVSKLENAEEKLKRESEIQEKIDSLKKSEILLSDKVTDLFKRKNREIQALIDCYQKMFKDDKDVESAKSTIKDLQERLSHDMNELNADVEKLNWETQLEQLAKLNAEYTTFISNYFDDLFKGIDVNIVNNLKVQSVNLQHYLALERLKIEDKTVVVGHEKIERSFWRKLWEWDFSEHYKDITERRQFVTGIADKLAKLDADITYYLENLANNLKQNAENLTETYCQQLNEKFKEHTKRLVVDLEEKAKQDDLTQEIEQAEKQLDIIKNCEETLVRNRGI